MRLKFNFQYFIIFVVLLVVEIFIALYIKDRFIRPFVGDVLSVCVLFSFIRTFYHSNGMYVSLSILVFAFGIEFFQYFQLASILNLEKGSLPYIMLGATYDPLDLLAYSIGTFFNIKLDTKYSKR